MVEERGGAEAPRSPSVEVEEEEESLVYSASRGRAYGGALGYEEALPHLYRPLPLKEGTTVPKLASGVFIAKGTVVEGFQLNLATEAFATQAFLGSVPASWISQAASPHSSCAVCVSGRRSPCSAALSSSPNPEPSSS